MTTTIGLLHPGQMGAAIAAQLRSRGARVLWCPEGRSPASIRRAEQADLEPMPLSKLAEASDIVVSLVPPAAAEDTAYSVLAEGFSGTFVDANAIRAERVAPIADAMGAAGAEVVDACVIGPAPPGDIPTRLFVAGAEARLAQISKLFAGTAVEVRPLGAEIGRASSLKTAQSVIQKGSRVIAAIGHALAADYGVGDELTQVVQAWAHPAADPGKFAGLATRAWRWQPELRDAATALDDSGLPSDPIEALAEALSRWEDLKDSSGHTLDSVLDALHTPKDTA